MCNIFLCVDNIFSYLKSQIHIFIHKQNLFTFKYIAYFKFNFKYILIYLQKYNIQFPIFSPCNIFKSVDLVEMVLVYPLFIISIITDNYVLACSTKYTIIIIKIYLKLTKTNVAQIYVYVSPRSFPPKVLHMCISQSVFRRLLLFM